MLLHLEHEEHEHFAQMEDAYSALLGSVGSDEYRSAGEALEFPLGELFYNAYLDFHPRMELATVDVVKFLGGVFLLDSQGYHNPEVSSRIVGALGIAQEAPTLKELLIRLDNAYRAGQSLDGTLELMALMGHSRHCLPKEAAGSIQLYFQSNGRPGSGVGANLRRYRESIQIYQRLIP